MPRLVKIDLIAARQMHDAGATWEEIGKTFGVTAETAHRKLDPAYDVKRRRQYAEARRGKDYPAANLELVLTAEPDTRTWQQRLFGDPPFSRSSLGKRQIT